MKETTLFASEPIATGPVESTERLRQLVRAAREEHGPKGLRWPERARAARRELAERELDAA